MKKTSKILITLLQAALLINLGGCLPMNEEQINAKAQAIYNNLTEPPPVMETEVQHELADEQILRLSARDISYVDTNRMGINDYIFMDQVFPGLTRKDPNSDEYLGALAKSWKASNDLQTWTFELQADIPWVSINPDTGEVSEVQDNSGNVRTVSAADFKAGLLNILNPENGSFQTYYLNTIVNAAEYASGEVLPEEVGIEAASDTELVIHTNQPNPYLDAIASLPIFSAIPSWIPDPVSLAEDTVDVMLYYGPYLVTEYMPETVINLVSNPFWPGTDGIRKPVLTEINYDLRTTKDVVNMYAEGEIDLLQLNTVEYEDVLQGSGLEGDVVTSPSSCGYYLFFKQIDSGLAASAEARQMIAAAINKKGLNNSIFWGTAQTLDHFVPAGVRGGLPQDDELGIPYDPENAAEYFEALVSEDPTIEPLQLYTVGWENYPALLESIAANLMDANVPISITQAEDWGEYLDTINDPEMPYNLVLTEYCMSYDDAQSLWDAWLDNSFFTTQSENWQSAAFYDLLDASLTESKLEKRAEKYAEMEAITVVNDAVVIPLLWESDYWLRRPTVDGPLLTLSPHFEDWAIVK